MNMSILLLVGALLIQLYPGIDIILGNLFDNKGYKDYKAEFNFNMIVSSDKAIIGYIIALGAMAGKINFVQITISSFIFAVA